MNIGLFVYSHLLKSVANILDQNIYIMSILDGLRESPAAVAVWQWQ
jgi:hypothetical protein